ncbi:uncharacterized protein LOC119497589 isoform X2 [Sebastes umbrosus]|uniref:uncharacterized protein LOC119497589 isoform X2 n=1 Tax=Sebastes umbrosus TaxID=72105 RepID=UPI00189CE053|nr:uncharacterized protein LOC119497589 isoform X2 [Sebastes umbrosus]
MLRSNTRWQSSTKPYNLRWVPLTMKLPCLIDLSLILILAASSKGQSWNVIVDRTITAVLGSNVTILCKFTVPTEHKAEHVIVYWKKPPRSSIQFFDYGDHNAFVFHPNDTLVLKKYRGRTQLIGNKDEGNCSLMILNITENEPNIYVRVITKGVPFSFIGKSVSISVPGSHVASVSRTQDIMTESSPTFEATTMGTTQAISAQIMYMAIFVPVAALLITIFVAGIVFWNCKKHKRTQSLTQQESGYYANFSRASTNQAKREASYEKQENNKLSEVKAIDEPIYINTEAPPGQMDHSMDHTENVYGNVDYSK